MASQPISGWAETTYFVPISTTMCTTPLLSSFSSSFCAISIGLYTGLLTWTYISCQFYWLIICFSMLYYFWSHLFCYLFLFSISCCTKHYESRYNQTSICRRLFDMENSVYRFIEFSLFTWICWWLFFTFHSPSIWTQCIGFISESCHPSTVKAFSSWSSVFPRAGWSSVFSGSYVSSQNQTVDIFTKAVGTTRFLNIWSKVYDSIQYMILQEAIRVHHQFEFEYYSLSWIQLL